MEGKFYTTSRKIRYAFGLVFGIIIVALAIYFEQTASFGDKKLWFYMSLVCGFGLSAVMIFLLAGLKRSLYADETSLKYNEKVFEYGNIRSVFPMSAGRDGTLVITMTDGRTVNVGCLENCSEISDFIRLRLAVPDVDIESTEKEIKTLGKKSRLILALLIAVFIVMAVILVLLLIQFYGNADSESNRKIIIFAIDELILACVLFVVSKKSTMLYARINEMNISLRKKKMSDMPVEDGCVRVLCDPDYRIRISVCRGRDWYAIAEMLTEDGGTARLDTSERYATKEELYEKIHPEQYVELSSEGR